MKFDVGEKTFLRAKMNKDNTFSVRINKLLLPKKSEKYMINIKLEDKLSAMSSSPTLLQI